MHDRDNAYLEDDLLWLDGRRDELAAQKAQRAADVEAANKVERPAPLNLKLQQPKIERLKARIQQGLQQYVGRTDVPIAEVQKTVHDILKTLPLDNAEPEPPPFVIKGTNVSAADLDALKRQLEAHPTRNIFDWLQKEMAAQAVADQRKIFELNQRALLEPGDQATRTQNSDWALKGSTLERLVASHPELKGLKIPPSDEPKPTDMTPPPQPGRAEIRIDGQHVGTATNLRAAPATDLSGYLYSWRWDGIACVTGHRGSGRTLFATAMANAFAKATGQTVVYFCASGQAAQMAHNTYAARCKAWNLDVNIVFTSWLNGQAERALRGKTPSLIICDEGARPALTGATCPILFVTGTNSQDPMRNAVTVWQVEDDGRVLLQKSRTKKWWAPLDISQLQASLAPAPVPPTETVSPPTNGPLLRHPSTPAGTELGAPSLLCPRHGHTPVVQAKLKGTTVSICGKCLDTATQPFEQEAFAEDSDVLKVKILLEEAHRRHGVPR